jgi:hypothetical protein
MTTSDPVRLEQGTNNDLAEREVGIMNVYEDEPGVLVAQIAVNDPATSKSERFELRSGATLTVGARQYRVVEIIPARGGERGAVKLAPISGVTP